MTDRERDTGRDPRERDTPKEPTHAPGEDAPIRPTGAKPYSVTDPSFADPGATKGAEPDLVTNRPLRNPTF